MKNCFLFVCFFFVVVFFSLFSSLQIRYAKVLLTLSAPNFRRHLSSAFFFNFNKLSLGKTFIYKVDRLDVKQQRSRLSRLIWIYSVCKSLSLSPVAVKELRKANAFSGDVNV